MNLPSDEEALIAMSITRVSPSSRSDGTTASTGSKLATNKLYTLAQAERPMPKDGLPIVGYRETNLYVVVSHSGITLGPLLGALAAGEILEDMSCDVLSAYRPDRFK